MTFTKRVRLSSDELTPHSIDLIPATSQKSLAALASDPDSSNFSSVTVIVIANLYFVDVAFRAVETKRVVSSTAIVGASMETLWKLDNEAHQVTNEATCRKANAPPQLIGTTSSGEIAKLTVQTSSNIVLL